MFVHQLVPWSRDSDGSFGIRAKHQYLPSAHLFTTQGESFILSLYIAERQAGEM